MSSNTDVRLTSGQRLARGLRYSVVGPADLTRGAVGVGVSSALSSASWLGRKLRKEDVVPEPRRRKPLLWIAVGAVVLAGGAAAFSIVRRSTRPEPSSLPPSVEVAPKP
ncbi:cell wall synthesis protein CwsA [Mycolicibacterium cosmeticum]|uniref:Cell wall synthesis protein CwsA n=1 Tax=Mycolicibacterium cosmeticum TaxID=258533 RepID=W9AZH9_MYCCO|nr:cell wall synthesis protein CwsA [Mycolicibacterium cosmeticum]TLH71673.1 cell wall synthesis protein CwsA [Mycolicibacterium cosmeticum]CDO07986.1 Cell wall synthesis and cell shape protein A [Mycolicibacterium cosmeticum]